MQKRKLNLLVTGTLLFLGIFSMTAQQQIGEILNTSGNFNEIVAAGENYFRAKHPGTDLRSLAEGDNRDGEYVKFMRWQHYWKNSLNADGTIGDPTAYYRDRRNREQDQQRNAVSPYLSAPWTNLSYEDYIISQIGLGRTTSIGFHPTDPNTFYVGAAIGGVWKTTDGGATYAPLGDELPFMAVSCVVVDQENPSLIYIAVSDHVWYGPPGIGVYKSVNGGATWQNTSLSFNLEDDVRIYWIEPDPANAARMYVATSDGLYRTTDRFLSVTKLNSKNTFDVKVSKGNSAIVFQGGEADGTFSRSLDGGNTFTEIQDFGSGRVYIANTALDPARVFARNWNLLYRSYDGGASFAPGVTMPESNLVMAFSETNVNTLLLGNFDCHRSDDGGSTFYATSEWLGSGGLPSTHVDQRNMFTNPLQPGVVYYCNDGGVYRYNIANSTFENLCDGLLITQFYDIAVSQSNDVVISGGSQDNGNVFRDSLGVWDDFAPTGDGMNQEIDPTNANIRYWAYQYGSMYRWVNGINTPISPPGQGGFGAWETPFRLDPTNPSRIIAGYSIIYESLDKGDTWTEISGFLSNDLQEIAISKSQPNRIYAAKNSSLYVKSTVDNTWTTRTLPGMMISDIEVDPLNMDVVYVTVPGFIAGDKVFRSDNAGVTWINISGSLPNVSTGAIEIFESMPGGLFVGTDAGVYYRDNTLPDWQKYGELPHTRVEDIEIQYSAGLIRIGTHGRGVLEAPIIIDTCPYGAADTDNDGICDANDPCNDLDNSLIGTPCDDGDPSTTGEYYTSDCTCGEGIPNAVYCAASSLTGTGGDWIKRVTLHTLDNETGFDDYGNYKSVSTTLAQGASYTLSVELFQSFPLDEVYAWIDFNRNGIFDAAELITMSAIGPDNISTGTVTVPANQGISPTVMRVRTIYADPNMPDPCGDYFGEVEDYTVRFTYCDAAAFFGTGSDWINNVSVNTIDHDSEQSFYSDFTHLSTDMARGGTYPIDVSLNYAFGLDSAFVWIDYDRDGIFETNEQTIMSQFTLGYDGTASGLVNVPANALPGRTKMRVRVQYADPNTGTPCGSAYAGEVEDYEVNITYCAALGSPGTGSDYITRVSLNTIDHISGQTPYSDFTSISTDLARGNAYPIEVELFVGFDLDSVYVWIDFNRNHVFEASEQIVMSQLPLGFNSVASGVVDVPADAVEGNTVMRVRAIYADPNAAESCGSYFGEVEDYSINLTYCAAEGSVGTGGDWISRVTFNTIDNQSGQTAYSNFKDISTILYRDNTYQLGVSVDYAFPLDEVYAWIDFNQDGVFSPNEKLNTSALGSGFSAVSSAIFTVTNEIPLGKTIMRTRVIYADPNPADPCGSYYGEVEDYTVIIADNQPGALCESGVILGNEVEPVATGIYSSADQLNSTSKVAVDSTVLFRAGNAVYLDPGFRADPGSVFSAQIAPCTPSGNQP